MISKSLVQFSVDGWRCVPSLLFTWGQTMVEVMKIMAISFKRSHECTATLSAPNPAAGHCWSTPLPETAGHSRVSLVQSLVGSLLLSPGFSCTQGSVCALQESVSPVLCKFWRLYGGGNGNFLQEGLCHTQVCCIQSPCPCAVPCWPIPPQGTLKHSSVSVSVGSLGPGANKVCLSPLSVLVGMGFDSKRNFAPPTIFLGLRLCSWMWGIFSKLLHSHAAAAPVPTVLLGLLLLDSYIF